MQSYFNPVLDALYAALALGPLDAHPRWLAAAIGLWPGAALYVAIRLAALLHGGRPLPTAAAILLAVTGTALVAQIGAVTGEVPAGVIMLSGLYVLLRGARYGALAAGLLFGVAAGLKLTAAAYAPAICLAAMAFHTPHRLRAGLVCAAAWLAGFAAADGWWALRLYRRFASPVFPLFNAAFRSLWYPPANFIDDRFVPHGPAQWLFAPILWLGDGASPGELPFHDPRAAIALCLGIAAAAAWALRLPHARTELAPPQRAALVFLAAGYAAWLATSAILRYAVVIEIVAGLSVPLLLGRIARGRLLVGGLALALLAALAVTRYPATARVPYGARTLQADMEWVRPGMLIVVTFRGPSAHAIASMPHQDGVEVLGIGNTVLEARGWRLHDEVVRRVRDHPGPIVVLTQGNVQGRFPELGEIGLDPALANCRPVATTFTPASPTGIHACDAAKRAPPPLPSPFWAQASRRYRTVAQPLDATRSLIGAAYLAAVGPPARGTRFSDWTDLLWHGVSGAGAPLPQTLDPATLYVLGPEHVQTIAGLLGPADALGRVDGVIVAAPGWNRCAECAAPIEPVRIAPPHTPLAPGDIALLGPDAAASGLLGAGWWQADAAGAWSREEAYLTLPLADGVPAQATLLLTGTAFTGPTLPTQRVLVEVPGQPGAAAVVTWAGDGAIRLPFRTEGNTLTVRLSMPDAESPARLGMSPDPRRLGISLRTAEIEAR